MGQTTVDLPDPMERRPAAGAAGADDLLDQLAGDEIDRLLAGIDVDPPPARPAPRGIAARAPTKHPDAQPSRPAARVARDDVAPASRSSAPAEAIRSAEWSPPVGDDDPGENRADVTPTEAAEAAEVTEAAADEGAPPAGLERLLARFDAPPAAEPLPDPPSFADAEASAAVDGDDAATSLAERGALDESDTGAFGAADDEPAPIEASAEGDDDEAEPLPLYLRPLEWLSAPLDALPGSAREAVGKVAIMALVDALAVLLYVLVFRH